MSTADEQAHWEGEASVSPWLAAWGADEPGTPAYASQVRHTMRMLVPPLPTEGRVLEIGCGPARLLRPLAEQYRDVEWVGVDLSPAMLDVAQAETCHLSNVTLAWCDGRNLAAELGTFDGVYSVLLFQHLTERAARHYVLSASRRLCGGGVLRFQYVPAARAPSGGPYDRHHDLRSLLWTAGELSVKDTEPDKLTPDWEWVTCRKLTV